MYNVEDRTLHWLNVSFYVCLDWLLGWNNWFNQLQQCFVWTVYKTFNSQYITLKMFWQIYRHMSFRSDVIIKGCRITPWLFCLNHWTYHWILILHCLYNINYNVPTLPMVDSKNENNEYNCFWIIFYRPPANIMFSVFYLVDRMCSRRRDYNCYVKYTS